MYVKKITWLKTGQLIRIAEIVFLLFIAHSTQAQVFDTVWLSDLDLTKAQIGWGKPGKNVSCSGHPIILNGVKYEKGFGSHAEGVLYLKLSGGCARFHAITGINDEEKSNSGSAIFTIYSSNEKLWQSEILRSGGTTSEVNISMAGIDTLILHTSTTNDGPNYDHSDWADAYFLVSTTKPFTIEIPREQEIILTPKAGPEPKIHGAAVYGFRPGNPVIYKVPVSGVRPLRYKALGLPTGLKIDGQSGIITGAVNMKGEYPVQITVSNTAGTTKREIIFKCGDTIALTPPMGWNSWNCFGCNVSAAMIENAAKAMINSGLADYGWSYINIDDCWMVDPENADSMTGGPARSANGNIMSNKNFASIENLVKNIHAMGLKAGLYSGPGKQTCAGFTASYGFEKQDAQQYTKWGFDYLKYDWCSYEQISPDHSLPELMKPYQIMNKALKECNRDIVYSLCQYGMGDVWKWGADVGGNLWRTTGDITDTWSSMESIGFGQADLYPYCGPGHWNDPDMLVVGQVGWGEGLHKTRLSPNEQYTHISLWALLSAPLLIGCDLTQIDNFTLNLLTNSEVIEINQDAAGKQARRILKNGDLEIWLKELSDGSLAIGLFNRGWLDADLTLSSDDLLLDCENYMIRDVWRQQNLGKFNTRFAARLPKHGCQLIKLTKP